MKQWNRPLVIVLLLLGTALPVAAQVKGDSPTMSIMAGAYLFDGQEHLQAGPELGVRLGYDLTELAGFEGSFSYITTNSRPASGHQVYDYLYRLDALVYLMPRSSFVPYLLAGGGIKQEIGSPVYGNRNSTLLNAGLGMKLFLDESVALRLEARGIGTIDYGKHINGEFAAGLTYHFGRGKAKVAALQPDPEGVAQASETVAAVTRPQPPAPAPAITAVSEPQVSQALSSPPPPTPPAVLPLALNSSGREREATNPLVKSITVTDDGLDIDIAGNVESSRVFTLVSPPRLVIDIIYGKNGIETMRIPINRHDISIVRLGKHPDFLRIVLDAAGDRIPPHRIIKTSTGLKVELGPGGRRG